MSRFTSVGPEFDDFVRASSAALLRTAFLLTNDRGQAEDLLQVSLVRTAAHWKVASCNPTGYARRVLVNLAKNRWRDMSRRPREAQGSGPAVLRGSVGGRSCAILGCGEGTVKSRTNRALSRLRELLAAQETDNTEGQPYAQRR